MLHMHEVAVYCRVGRLENLEPHEREKALVWKGGKACADKGDKGRCDAARQ